MELETSSLNAEVEQILFQGKTPVHYYWTLTLITPKQTLDTFKVVSVAIVRDYAKDYADDIVVEVLIPRGTFHHRIYPYRDQLEAVLYREPLHEVDTGTDLTQDIEAQRMHALLIDTQSDLLNGYLVYADDEAGMNLTDILTVKIALTDPVLNKLRMMTIDGQYRNVTTPVLLRHLLTVASQTVSRETDTAIQGVDWYPPTNNQVLKNVLIPSGTRLTDLPDYLNAYCGGIYSTGFGFFLQKHHWYMYPLYDLTRYDNSAKGLTLIKVPPTRLSGVERSYRTTANQVIALTAQVGRVEDDSNEKQLNLGNGLRMADAAAVFDQFGNTAQNKTIVERKTNNSEFAAVARPDQLNNLQFASSRISTNVFYETSKLARRLGMFLVATWEHSDPGAIWPGMPVRYLYSVNGEVFECHGIVQSAQHYITLAQPGITTHRHVSNTTLLIFMSKPTPWKE